MPLGRLSNGGFWLFADQIAHAPKRQLFTLKRK
jgi:hypothetical protein